MTARAVPKEPPRPLVVHVIFALGTGGMENGLVNLINHMPRDRYRHAIVCLTSATDFADRLIGDDVPVYELHKPPGNSIKVLLELLTLLRRLKPAIVHTRNTAALECQVLGLFLPRAKQVHGEHGRDVADLHGKNRKYRWLRRVLSPLIARFICVSRDLQCWLVDDVGISSKKVVQIYNGVDLTVFSGSSASPPKFPVGFTLAENALVVGTVGRLVAVKDQRTLLCAVEHIISIEPALAKRLRVIVVGDGPLRETLEQQAAGLGKSVCFIGETADVAAYLTAMDVFVLPSLGEGVSNTILEAMSCGLAVVASDVGGNPELVVDGETGCLFPVGDSEALARRLLDLFHDKALLDRLGSRGRELVVTRHSWDAMVNAYLAVYDDCLSTA